MQFWASALCLAAALVAVLALVYAVPLANDYLTKMSWLLVATATILLLADSRRRRGMGQDPGQPPTKAQQELDPPLGDAETGAATCTTGGHESGATVAAASARPRLDYLDNLKSVLTIVVVVHHVTCCFAGGGFYLVIAAYPTWFGAFGQALLALDQSYFMSLFFFVSGYFTPGSYDRKGPRAFLVDKVWRLGLPFLAYLFAVGPAVQVIAQQFAGGPLRYSPEPGPPWFVAWLLLFNAAYCMIGDAGSLSAPGLGRIVLWGLGVGLVQLLLLATVAAKVDSNFLMMPFSIGSLPFDILFFGCGCAAKRNKWLDQLPLQGWGGRLLYPLAVLLGAVLSTGIVVLWVEGLFEGAGPDFSTYPLWAEIGFPALLILFGVACTVFSLAAVQLFKSHFNVTGPRWKFLSQAAYGVYLIHPLVVVPLVGAYIALLRSRGEHIEFPPGSTISSSHLSNDGWIWLGWAATCVLSVGVAFPLAAGLRRLPLLRDIL